ncbi:alpha/beta fold hydrolase [Streptomyces sp. NPDC053493]|uniref:alpha/beta fold hydrolase n=1 Tax=Streptomyces sp. NPDC053493 TaxID=3365705 RepID=UPI0037D4C292
MSATHPPAPSPRVLTATSADGSRLHVEVYGPEGAPAVVLAHGWTCSTRFWDAQIRDLAADHRVVVYDQRGHGGSPAPEPGAGGNGYSAKGHSTNGSSAKGHSTTGYSTEALADDLEAVLAATLGPGERAVLAGHSMGGMTLMAAAGRPLFRQHAAAALLCSTGPSRLTAEALVVPLRPGGLRTRLTAAVLGAKAPLGPVTPVSKKILKYATMGPGTAPERVDACARIVHACPRGARHGWSQVLAGLDLEAGVRELRLPVAVLVGTADRLTPPGHSRAMAAALPHCTGLVELAGTGHMTPVEAPEAVTAQIRELTLTYLGVTERQAATTQQKEEAGA